VLRIATTVSARWIYVDKESTKSTNGVYALNSDMEIIGSLRDIAEDESIYSTRFIGNKLYMVTYKQWTLLRDRPKRSQKYQGAWKAEDSRLLEVSASL
jgi:uncharacterized secreted protein with C-terminal beta-propeller domain